MERREFIKIACGFVGALPLAAHAQQQLEKQRLIGILGADATVWRPWTAALTARLGEAGWTEGDNIAIEYRWATGRSDCGCV
jgi:putative ABC transport system substrate-binding protein